MRKWRLRICLRLLGYEVQEIPLRHEGDEFAVSGEMREISHDDGGVIDLSTELAQFLVRAAQEVLDKTQFIHQFECGRMDRISAKIPQKVGVFFRARSHLRRRRAPARKPAIIPAGPPPAMQQRVVSFSVGELV